MIYEFIGLPGSGKTYHAQRLSSEIGAPMIGALSRKDRFLGALCFATHRPLVVMRLVRELFCETHVSAALLWHKLFFLLGNALARESVAMRFETAVIDEGLAQYIYSLYEHRITVRDIQRYFDIVKLPEERTVTIIEASDNIRHERMAARGRVPRSAFGLSYGESWEEVLSSNHRLIAQHLPEMRVGAHVGVQDSC